MFLRDVKRIFTGQRLHQCEAVIDGSRKKFGLELRRESGNGDLYLLVTLDSGVRSFIQLMDVAGLDGLADVVASTQAAIAKVRDEGSRT